MNSRTRQRGSALIGALVGLAVAGALAGLALSAARLRALGAARQLAQVKAVAAARSALDAALAGWDPALADTLPIGTGAVHPGIPDSLLRLGLNLYLLRGSREGRTADSGLLARESLARLVALYPPRFPDSGAVQAVGPVRITGLAAVDGTDQAPAGWGSLCPAPRPAVPGVWPLPVLDSTTALGRSDVSALAWWAERSGGGTVPPPAPVVAGGTCDRTDPQNWGDPGGAGPCAEFLPIVRLAPGTVVTGGQAQGLVLADGAVVLAGDFTLAGVMVALGPVRVRDQATITGVLLAGDSVHLEDQAQVRYSSCAMARAAAASARPGWGGSREWWSWP